MRSRPTRNCVRNGARGKDGSRRWQQPRHADGGGGLRLGQASPLQKLTSKHGFKSFDSVAHITHFPAAFRSHSPDSCCSAASPRRVVPRTAAVATPPVALSCKHSSTFKAKRINGKMIFDTSSLDGRRLRAAHNSSKIGRLTIFPVVATGLCHSIFHLI